ncbi:hypothetical protein MTO96_019237 [Rhipicephalus appendiculatus]
MSLTLFPGPSSSPANHLVASAGSSDEPTIDFQDSAVDFATQRHETPLAHGAAKADDDNWKLMMRSQKRSNKEGGSLHRASCEVKPTTTIMRKHRKSKKSRPTEITAATQE